jgi:signal transduction histidine kinase/CheY-like chemotaxis protein
MSGVEHLLVAVITPNDVDAVATTKLLVNNGIAVQAMSTVHEFGGLSVDSVGCVVIVEEALGNDHMQTFRAALQFQPPWSDLPVIFVSSAGAPLAGLRDSLFPDAGNVTLLERPFNPVTLLSAIRVALRARARQFEVRALLEERLAAVTQRDEFLAILAHELRNPLAPLRNAAYLMGNLNIDDPVFRKTRVMIERQIAHMGRLVDDLLDVSRLELGKLELRMQPIDLNACIASATEAAATLLTARGHRLKRGFASGPLSVMGDAVRIEQMLTNLMSNAAKFTPDGGTISVIAFEESGWGVIEVTDTGCGMPEHLIPLVFEAFRQGGQQLSGGEGGLGIGLTIVKRLVHLHGGTVEARSAGVGKGATFVLRLPLCPPLDGMEAKDTESTLSSSAPKRVLIVEDNADIRESMAMLLSSWGHNVARAESGPDGVEQAFKLLPDVALIDIGLPGLNGYDVARSIRRGGSRWAKNVRLIAVTGYGQSGDRRRALEAGFDAHMLKPVDPVALAGALLEGPSPN